MKTGVYTITNKVNGKFYVGSTGKSFAHRWGLHKAELRKGTNKNRYLQRAWDKYGEDNFEFKILEYVEKSKVIEVEQKWIDYYRCFDRNIGYNICIIATSRAGTKLDGISKNAKVKPIYCFTLDGTFVNTFLTTLDVVKGLFTDVTDSRGVWAALTEITKSYRGYVFTYQDIFPGYIRGTNEGMTFKHSNEAKAAIGKRHLGIPRTDLYKAIEQWKDGKFIKCWPSLQAATQTLKINCISMAANGHRKSAGGFQWVYSNFK